MSGLAAGAYAYDALAHRLIQVRERDAHQCRLVASMHDATGNALNRDPSAVLLITAVFERIMAKYTRLGLSLIYKDVGALMQTLYLVGTALGLAPCAIGGGDEAANSRWLGLNPLHESQVGWLPASAPAQHGGKMTASFSRDPGPLRLRGIRERSVTTGENLLADAGARAALLAADLTLGAWRSTQVAAEICCQLGLPVPEPPAWSDPAALIAAPGSMLGRLADRELGGDRVALEALGLARTVAARLEKLPGRSIVILVPRYGAPWERCDVLFTRFLSQALTDGRHAVVLWAGGEDTLKASCRLGCILEQCAKAGSPTGRSRGNTRVRRCHAGHHGGVRPAPSNCGSYIATPKLPSGAAKRTQGPHTSTA